MIDKESHERMMHLMNRESIYDKDGNIKSEFAEQYAKDYQNITNNNFDGYQQVKE